MLRKAEIIDPEKDDEEIKDEIAAGKGTGGDNDAGLAALLAQSDVQDAEQLAALEDAHPELNETAGA
jgi:hypothetical protein